MERQFGLAYKTAYDIDDVVERLRTIQKVGHVSLQRTVKSSENFKTGNPVGTP